MLQRSTKLSKMQSTDQGNREDPLPPRTLEFRQAMRDFRTMFPTIESDLIECVLRSNAGHVDSTIDQLLQLSQDASRTSSTRPSRSHDRARGGNQFNIYDDSTDSEDSIPSELLDPLTSSDDDDVPVRDPPPMYTPRAGDPAPNFFGSNTPIEVPLDEKKKGCVAEHGINKNHHGKQSKKTYRAWNPPMLGSLPEDFLRILPQQFIDLSTDTSKTSQKKQMLNGQRSFEKRSSSRGNHSVEKSMMPNTQHPNLNSQSGSGDPEDAGDASPGPVPPPRPSRTIDSHNSRRISQKPDRERRTVHHSDNIERGNLFIQPAAFPDNRRLHEPADPMSPSNGHRPRHHHHRSARSRSSTAPNAILSSSFSGSGSSSSSRTRQRSQFEEEQYVEDCRLAILLQNEEFIHELKRNEEFLKALEKDRHKDAAATERTSETSPAEKAPTKDRVVPLPDPDAKYPHGSMNSNNLKRAGTNDSDKDDERAFKENLRHMGKSARKKFNEIARKFAVKRKTSYKSMRTIDPVFANCDDNFDELPGPQPPTMDL